MATSNGSLVVKWKGRRQICGDYNQSLHAGQTHPVYPVILFPDQSTWWLSGFKVLVVAVLDKPFR